MLFLSPASREDDDDGDRDPASHAGILFRAMQAAQTAYAKAPASLAEALRAKAERLRCVHDRYYCDELGVTRV